MRIAIAGISNENTNFSPILNRLPDFTILADDDLLTSGRYPFLAQFEGITFLPTLFAHSLPGGPIAVETYHHLKEGLLSRLRALGPMDGVYLDLHGAMYVEGMSDAEADLASAVRKIVGSDALIAASMDLHGNISQKYVDLVDIITAYRTAPHRDTLETRQRSCELLVQSLQSDTRPQIALVPIPVLLAGEMTRTDMEPGATLWGTLPEIDQRSGVLHAALFVGFAWVDEERAHAAAVVTGTDRRAIEAAAREIAQSYWNARHQFHFGTPSGTIDECIAAALATSDAPIFLSDSGDNVTAGAAGDLPLVLERLLAYAVPNALVAGLCDAEAVTHCQRAGVGATVDVTLGGKLDTTHGKPLLVRARVVNLIFSGEDATHAILQVAGVTVVVISQRQGFTSVADFTNAGIDPLAYKIVVVKLGYLFPELIEIAAKAWMALSPGAADLDLARLSYQRIARPMFPKDQQFDWKP